MNINGAQIHLLINHAPVIGFPLVLLTYLWGKFKREVQVEIYAFYLTIVIWVTTAISFLTGDLAEEKLESLPHFAKELISTHDNTAENAFIIASIVAVMAILSLPYVQKYLPRLKEDKVRSALQFGFCTALMAVCILLAIVAHQGGLIRHTELR